MNVCKVTNDILVLDLEATSRRADDGVQEYPDIIQIGAVYLNRELEITGKFDALVRPQEEISPDISELTGITNEKVASADYFDTVAKDFEAWASTHTKGSLKKIKLAAWGSYFDIPLLRQDYRRYGRHYVFGGSALCIKTLATFWLSLSGRRMDKASVEHVARLMDITFEGQAHNALADAMTEAKILQRIFQDLDGGAFVDVGTGRTRLVKVK